MNKSHEPPILQPSAPSQLEESIQPPTVVDISRFLRNPIEPVVLVFSDLDANKDYNDTGIFYTLQIGYELGFEIKLITPDTFFQLRPEHVSGCKLVIVDKLEGFNDIQLQFIKTILFERPMRFILVDRDQKIPNGFQMLRLAERIFCPVSSLVRKEFSEKTEIFPFGIDVDFMVSNPMESRFKKIETESLSVGYCSMPGVLGSLEAIKFTVSSLYNKEVIDAVCAGCAVHGPGTEFISDFDIWETGKEFLEYLQFCTYEFWHKVESLI